MSGQPVQLSPWPGGLNTLLQAADISDHELSDAYNLDFGLDGSLVSRPAFVVEDTGPNPTSGHNATALDILGVYLPTGGTAKLVVADDAGTYLYEPTTSAWTTIWAYRASGFVQYLDNAVLCCLTHAGGYWNGATFTATASMPNASEIVLYQERFWAFGVAGTAQQSRIYFSNLTVISPASSIYDWTTATDFFEVGDGDGQKVNAIIADPNMLLIFREHSTYGFTFPDDPGNGTLRVISTTLGAESKHCIASHQGFYFVFNAGHLYQFVTYQFYPLDRLKVALLPGSIVGSSPIPYAVSVFGSRVIVWALGAVYVYNIDAKAWSRWSSALNVARWLPMPESLGSADPEAYGVSGDTSTANWVLFHTSELPVSPGGGESFLVRIRTKAYSLNRVSLFKRIFYWVAELVTAVSVTGSLYPQEVASGGGTTWDNLDTSNWDTLSLSNWDALLSTPTVFSETVDYPLSTPASLTVRFPHDTRFLRMIFELSATIDGTTSTAPFRIRGLTAYVTMKDRTSKEVS